jgi:hypothetical protein
LLFVLAKCLPVKHVGSSVMLAALGFDELIVLYHRERLIEMMEKAAPVFILL